MKIKRVDEMGLRTLLLNKNTVSEVKLVNKVITYDSYSDNYYKALQTTGLLDIFIGFQPNYTIDHDFYQNKEKDSCLLVTSYIFHKDTCFILYNMELKRKYKLGVSEIELKNSLRKNNDWLLDLKLILQGKDHNQVSYLLPNKNLDDVKRLIADRLKHTIY